MKKTTILVMIVTIIAKIFGFLRDRVLSHYFGVGIVTDAFMLAFGVPSMVLTVVAAAFVTGFIPMYTRVKNESKEEANVFVNNIFNIMVCFALVLGVLMFIMPGVFVKVTAFGFQDETFKLATQFVRILSVSVIFVAIIQLGTGYLNVHRSFIIPNLLSIPSNLIIVSATIYANKMGSTIYLPYAALLGYGVQATIIYVYMMKYGFRFKAVFDFKDPHLIKMLTLAGPLLISTMVLSVQDLITMSSATLVHGDGGYSYISMSTRLMGFSTGLFVTGVLSVAYPMISQAASENNKVKVIHSMNDAILLISLFIIPATVGFMTLGTEVVNFVYGGGEVGAEEVAILASVFKAAAAGLMFIALKDLFMRIHYAYQDSMTPLKAQIVHALSGTLLVFVLGYLLGLKGVTLAITIASGLSGAFLFLSLLKRFKRLGMRMILKDLIKIIISATVMGLVIILSKYLIMPKIPGKLGFIIVLVLAVLTYGAMALGLRIQVLYDLFDRSKD